MLMTTDPGDLVLDPTCGSGTTAYVAEQWGRRWITIDTSRVALALARTRLMAARFPYYLLADSPEGRKKEAELTGYRRRPTPRPASTTSAQGLRLQRVPHVTLKSIANNPDIKEGMTREADRRGHPPARRDGNALRPALRGQEHRPRDRAVHGREPVAAPHAADGATPTRPGIGGRRRPPPGRRRLRDHDPRQPPQGRRAEHGQEASGSCSTGSTRSPASTSRPRATYTESGASKAVRVSVGPEFGTVGPEWISEGRLEAIKGSRCDLLLVCGFAFDPHVSEQTEELTKETRSASCRSCRCGMNPDLAMGDELLKKTGAGNLFMVFGEPDIDAREREGRQGASSRSAAWTCTTRPPARCAAAAPTTSPAGSSTPTTTARASSSATPTSRGADEPYEKLKKALRAEIDEGEWAKLYSTTSRPFDPPKTGKIAVKVINHYGDEVLKVFRAP